MAKTETLSGVVDRLIDALPEGNPDIKKLERTRDQYSEEGLAMFLHGRGVLPVELQHKYGLDKTGSNVAAGEIPEEAPEYVGDVDTAGLAGLDALPEAVSSPGEADLADEQVVADYNDLSRTDLQAEVKARNDERDDEDTHIVPASQSKADLVAALEADDEG